MDNTQKTQILKLRNSGVGYSVIASELGISENTVKSYCRRNNIKPGKTENLLFCKHCGKSVKQNPKRKAKQFCSDKCRMSWWNSHRDQINHHVQLECLNCHKQFSGDSSRKFCSHSCYIAFRYGGNNG